MDEKVEKHISEKKECNKNKKKNKRKIKKIEEEYEKYTDRLCEDQTLFFTSSSLRSAFLAAGTLLSCIDEVVDKGGMAFVGDRPPGKRFLL